ncbi:fimbrial protein [Pseudomonas syringae]|uniref:Fimbrial protein n=1 Tax=Pseudomonas syringae TaxID=317 RepID=A0A9Q3ZVW3_PSESX|nr:fimbrial protein [Pseudomonas syringae]MCF5064765.1 fimbrial protein [Pseudomonas syringae]MCF5075407.1 fimbrial protein [Pseudomonas syringae]MCF5121434.1 fimbrial protein [Pseudomonas syringae]MCF5380982.1 fimbrial protein [Pseudomonas syringae]
MRHQKVHKAWSCAGLAMLLSVGLAPSAQAADNLRFMGNLVEQACTIRPGDEALTVELWDVTSTHLYINTRTVGKGFRLHLDDCNTTISESVSITFAGRENAALPGLFALDGGSGASGIGLGIETPSKKLVPVNIASDEQRLTPGNNVIELKAFVQGEPNAIRDKTIEEGAYRVTSIFTLDYP